MKNKAFTLVELMVAIVILWLLMIGSIVGLWKYVDQGKATKHEQNLIQLKDMIHSYYAIHWEYPEFEWPIVENNWKKWELSEALLPKFPEVKEFPKNPYTNENYSYYLSLDTRNFQFWGVDEEGRMTIIKDKWWIMHLTE